MISTSDVLRAGKAELLRCGWHQGNYYNEKTGERCMLGALLSGTEHQAGSYRLINEACDALIAVIGDPHVALWNDEPGRTPEEVLNAFDRAIALAEYQEPSVTADAVSVQVDALAIPVRA